MIAGRFRFVKTARVSGVTWVKAEERAKRSFVFSAGVPHRDADKASGKPIQAMGRMMTPSEKFLTEGFGVFRKLILRLRRLKFR